MSSIQPTPGQVLMLAQITEEMHVAAVKVLHRANGVDGLPQRMLDAMLGAMPPVKQDKLEEWARVPDAVWEALQRMIEDGLAKGPNSQDDARTVARWRARFVPARDGVPSSQPDLNPVPSDRARALAIAAEAKKHLSDDRTHLTKLIYVNDLVWALGVLAESGDVEPPQKWVDDPHDIEGGQMLNPKWLQARNLTPQEALKEAHVTPAEDGPDFTVQDPDLDALLNIASTMVRATVGGSANMDDGLLFLSSLNKVQERLALADEVPRLRNGIKNLIRAYVNLMEVGRDRIVGLGGQCDPLDVMERSDPNLRQARDVLATKKELAT